MKKTTCYLLFAIFMTGISASFGQSPGSFQHNKEYYLKKSRKQNTAGWALFIPGTVAGLIGFFAYGVEKSQDGSTNEAGLIVGMAGLGLMGGGVTLFHAAKKNRKKALQMTLHISPLGKPGNYLSRTQIPAIGVKLIF